MRMQGLTRAVFVVLFLCHSINASHASAIEISDYSFLYTQNNKDNTRALFAASIRPSGVERIKLDHQSYATYPWTDIVCLCHNRLFAMKHTGLQGLDLETGQVKRVVGETLPHYERLSYLDNRAYGIHHRNGSPHTLVILDFDRLAYRQFRPNPTPCYNPAVAVSPDHELLAYHTQDPNGYLLTVIKTDTGELVCQSRPFDFQLPMIASVVSPPPLAWVDQNRILSIESYTRDGFLTFILKKRTFNQLIEFRLDRRRIRDILTLPGNPMAYFPPRMVPQTNGQPPRLVQYSGGLTGDYRVDLKARKLVKDGIMGSPYRLNEKTLYFGDRALGHTRYHELRVDPARSRVAWLENGDLHYHDDTQANPILVAKGCDIRGLTWIDPGASGRDLSETPLPQGWTRFE